MAWSVTADPDRFEEAIEWFEGRVPVTAELRELLTAAAAERAFTVSGLTELQAVVAIFRVLLKGIEDGEGLGWFKAQARDTLKGFTSTQVETVFSTNVQTAYNRGRWHQLQRPEVKRHRPYLMYDAVLDTLTSPVCRARGAPPNGPVVLPAEDPWWRNKWPPLHHRCRSSARALTRRQAERRGLTESTDDLPETPGDFGKAPTEQEWQPDPSAYPPELWALYLQKQAARA